MKPIFIGIAGASGAGKSTLCTYLQEKYPDQIGLIQLDDYFKKQIDVPKYKGHDNWDSPDALRLDQLYQDLLSFQKGESVMVWTKNEKLNPDYKKTDKRIEIEFQPKPVMLVEGYLVLHDERIRNLFETSIFLDIDQRMSWKRRVHFKNDAYFEEVILPMNTQYVIPTKQLAEHVIDVSNLSKKEVFQKAEEILNFGG
ncbi:hypothetical protein KC866_01255 [Patescibacteria group bacterium]|nr:hypothetical protein [Patescibacteria group bacterium]